MMRPKDLTRVRYFQGQELRATDLRDDVAYEARLRALHGRGLHNTWGVALGFKTGLNRNRDGLIVEAGMAYDSIGRAILSSGSVAVPAPEMPPESSGLGWWFDLVIAYHNLDDDDQRDDIVRVEPLDMALQHNHERPRWHWVYAGAMWKENDPAPPLAECVRLGEEIPLARVRLTPNGVLDQLDFSLRRSTQGLVRPHIASGTVTANAAFDADHLAWTTWINTAEGGFSNWNPTYFVRLAVHPLESFFTQTSAALRWILGPFLSIRDASQYGFRLDMRLAVSADNEGAAGVGALLARQINLPLEVEWVGLESVAGCQPQVLYLLNYWNFVPVMTFVVSE